MATLLHRIVVSGVGSRAGSPRATLVTAFKGYRHLAFCGGGCRGGIATTTCRPSHRRRRLAGGPVGSWPRPTRHPQQKHSFGSVSFSWIQNHESVPKPPNSTGTVTTKPTPVVSVEKSMVRIQCELIVQYATEGFIDRAEECMRRLMASRRRSLLDDETTWIALAIESILQAYTRSNTTDALASSSSDANNSTHKRQLVERADRLVQSIDEHNALDVVSYDRILCALMEVNVSANMLSRAESVLLQLDRRHLGPYVLLMQAYGEANRPDQATRLLHRVLKDTHIDRPTLHLFHVVLDAWTKSSRFSDVAFHQAFQVLRLTEYDDGCLTSRVRPDRTSFHKLLQCLIAHGYRVVDEHDDGTADRAGLMARVILDSMNEFVQQGDELVRPNAHTYELAIQACHRAGDSRRADILENEREQLKVQ